MKPILLMASLLVSGLASAQANRVIFENDKVRVLVIRYAPGEKTAIGEHPNGLQVALTERRERLTSKAGNTRDIIAKPGDADRAGGEYMTENLSSQFSDVLVVELKTDPTKDVSGSFLNRDKPSAPANEASAMATLRTLNTAEVTFASTYNQGFTDTLNRLGQSVTTSGRPSADHADLVDPDLAGLGPGGFTNSFTKNGYRFTYTPQGQWRLVAAYEITAEPVDYGVTGVRSFYIDQSAVIRATSEKRPATAGDNPI